MLQNVIAVVTLVPGPTFNTFKDKNNADVHDDRAALWLIPMYSANSCSNCFVFGPVPVQALRMQPDTASASLSVYDGGENGRFSIDGS